MTACQWTIAALSVEFGRDRRTIAKRLAGVPVYGKQGNANVYMMTQAAPAILGIESGEFDYEKERARTEHYKAEELERKVRTLDGDLLDKDEVTRAWSDRVTSARGRLLALPTRAAVNVVAVADEGPRVVEEILRDVVYEALEDLERDWTNADSYSASNDDSGEAVGATADSDGHRVGRKTPVPKSRKRSRTR